MFVAYSTGSRIGIEGESFTRLRTLATLKHKLIYVRGHNCYARATEEFNRDKPWSLDRDYLTNILHCNLFEALYLESRPNHSSV